MWVLTKIFLFYILAPMNYYTISFFHYSQHHWTFNPSVNVMLFPERTTNLARGQGFRTNDEVLQRFAINGQYNEALNYFGFEGTYDSGSSYAGYVDKKGNIIYGDLAFKSNFDYLFYVASEEKFHQIEFRTKYKNVNWDDNSFETSIAKNEGEYHAKLHQYRNQGLFRNAYGNNTVNRIIKEINYYGIQIDAPTYYYSKWQVIYRIPRLW